MSKQQLRTVSLDTETTGLDMYHSARPFFVTTCDGSPEQTYWEAEVNPETREVYFPPEDVRGIRKFIQNADRVVLQNGKFDVAALRTVGIEDWPWDKTEDTLIAGHLLASNQPHDLTSMALHYLGVDISPYEVKLKEACRKARHLCRTRLKGWSIAKDGRSDMPSVTKECWHYDTWLPNAVAERLEYSEDHPWRSVLRDYANADSAVTLSLWEEMGGELRRRGLWKIYRARMGVVPYAAGMERRGVTVSGLRSEELEERYRVLQGEAGLKCVNLAASMGHELALPKAGNNKSLLSFATSPTGLNLKSYRSSSAGFDSARGRSSAVLMPHSMLTETGNVSLGKDALEHCEAVLGAEEPRGKRLAFVRSLRRKRKLDTALSYLASYTRFRLPLEGQEGWFVLHPSFNMTGTQTLRWSSSCPNAQNISKQEDFNLRYPFGPAPGREWWSLDYENIELRIPAYESGERCMIELFERPDDPPYFGSYHLLNASILYPDLFWPLAGKRGAFKERYGSTWYQRVKNFGFACVPMDTLALTRDGWKSYKELKVGDLVLGYDGGKLRWTPVLEKMMFADAPLIEMQNNHFRSVSTPDHRWVCRRRTGRGNTRRHVEELRTTENINSECEIYLSAPVDDSSKLDITDDEAALIGFAYGDGSVVRSKMGYGPARRRGGDKVGFLVKFYQSKPRGIKYIETLLARWGKGFRKYEYEGDPLITWLLNPEACRSIWKRAGLWEKEDFEQFVLNLGTSQRAAFIEAVWEAEGYTCGTGKVYTQNDGAFADSIRLAVFMTGNFCTTQSPATNYYTTDKTCRDYRACNPMVTGQMLRKTYQGRANVWCIKTELGSWVMRQGDMIMLTGNCSYGAVPESGTADRAAHKAGAQLLVMDRLKEHTKLNRKYVDLANKYGYVETLPDKTVDSERGYPIMCTRTDYGRVLETVPLNYHVQSTAMWCTMKAMVRCGEYLERLSGEDGRGYYMVMQVHDELVFDFPEAGRENLEKVNRLKGLMEESGRDVGIPLRVSVTYNPVSWSKGGKV
jgi:DNA polymerase I-like protein with 3'-5' exonuclease and polymerase domains